MSGKKEMNHYSDKMKEQTHKEIQAKKSRKELSRKYEISRYAIQS